jgi:hypothetical protein
MPEPGTDDDLKISPVEASAALRRLLPPDETSKRRVFSAALSVLTEQR